MNTHKYCSLYLLAERVKIPMAEKMCFGAPGVNINVTSIINNIMTMTP